MILLQDHTSVDIVSPYLAGWFFDQGEGSEIYGFAASEQFSALPPPAWRDAAQARGFTGTYLTPYLYAPLWAAVLAPVAAHFTIAAFVAAVFTFQIPLIFISMFLCWHLAGRPGWFSFWAGISSLLFFTNAGGLLALSENQPQITVFFLVLLGFWLFQIRYFRWAGLVFALAASLKITPLVFGLLFVAKKQWQGAAVMLAAGTLLLGASFFLAGFSLHTQFYEQIQNISGHVFVSRHNWSLSSLLFQLQNDTGWREDVPMYLISETPGWIRIFTSSLFMAGLIGFVVLFSKSNTKRQQFRVFLALIVLIGLVSPLGWSHNFLPLIYAAPVFLIGQSPRAALLLLIGIFSAQSLALQLTFAAMATGQNWGQIGGTLSIIFALLVILWDARKTNSE